MSRSQRSRKTPINSPQKNSKFSELNQNKKVEDLKELFRYLDVNDKDLSSIRQEVNNKQDAIGFTPENVANKQADLTPSATKYPTVDAVNSGLSGKANVVHTHTSADITDFAAAALTAAPAETASSIGSMINGSTAATPNDTDLVATADASVLKKITWTSVKAFLKTYFDTLYQVIGSYVPTTRTITINGTTQDLSADRSWTVGGAATWGSITGTLSSQTDLQTALDAKVDENPAIVGATKTKITYDSKGLVTAGTDATTADINDSLNRRYVTDAQLTVIGNTSGTNSGDQTSIVGISGTKAQFDAACSDGDFLYVGDVTQYTDENAQDAVGAMAVNSTFVNLTYDDGTPSLTPSLSATGTPDNTKFLRGDNTWAVPTAAATLTSVQGAASGDVTMASTNTWYTGASVALTAGTWLVNAHITLNRTTTTAQQYQVRIQDTTNTVSFASSQQYQASVANAPVNMSLTAIVTLAGSATVAIQAASSTSTNNLIKAATLANGSGNNATKITAIKIA